MQEQIPDNHTEEEEEYLLRHAELTHIVEEHVQDSRRNQVSVCHVSAIEQCDDQYAADVVHHANAVRNIFRLNGTRLPSKLSTPNEKAMSVAIGIAIPRVSGVPEATDNA